MVYNFREENVTIKGEFDLGATITIPEKAGDKMPAIVLVAGTGNGDRDGNIKSKKFNMNIYKDLAHFFAKLGFVTIRYDKRGVGESKGSHIETSFNDLVEDVIRNAKYLKDLDCVDKVILCGHSEGSILVAVANERYAVDGLIQIAGAGMCIRKALEFQNYLVSQEAKATKGLKGWIIRKQVNEKNYLDRVNNMFDKCNSTDKDVIRIQGMKTPAKWFREHDSYTDEIMGELMKKANCPILAITGDKDVQANPEYIEKIKNFNEDHITAILVPNMDHILKEYNGDLTVLNIMKQYKAELGKPLHEGFLMEIENWINANKVNLTLK